MTGKCLQHRPVALWRLALFALAAFIFLLIKWQVFSLDQTWAITDTYLYLQVAQQPVTSLEFWVGIRPFTLPLIYKVLGLTSSQPIDHAAAMQVAWLQFSLSIVAWLSLACSLAFALRRWPLAALAGFPIALAFGATLDIALWDHLLLSESVSSSLLAILLAVWVFLLDDSGRTISDLRSWRRWAFFGSLGTITVLYSFTRDANGVVVASAGLLGLGALVFQHVRRSPIGRFMPWMSLIMVMAFVAQMVTVSRGERWLRPFLNVFYYRVLPYPEHLRFFENRGLSAASLTREMRLGLGSFISELNGDPDGREVREWLRQHGRSTYLWMLAQDPVYTLGKPIQRSPVMLGGDNSEFRRPIQTTPSWVQTFSAIFFPRNPWLVIIVVGASLAAIAFMRFQSAPGGLLAEAVALLVLAYPMAFVVWHGDAIELERHAFQIALQVRLAMWMLALAALQALLSGLGSKSSRPMNGRAVQSQ